MHSEGSDTAASLLLVDDDEALLQALPETLKLRVPSLEVDVCTSGQAALERIRVKPYHVLITDLTMPGMNGLDLLREVRREYPQLPVLLLTGHGEDDLTKQALEEGVYDFIYKPVSRPQFLLSVLRALETQHLRAHAARHQAIITRLHNHLRQLQQVWRPLLLGNITELSTIVGDDRLEESWALLQKALSMCDRQSILVEERIAFSEEHLLWCQETFESRKLESPHQTSTPSKRPTS